MLTPFKLAAAAVGSEALAGSEEVGAAVMAAGDGG